MPSRGGGGGERSTGARCGGHDIEQVELEED